MRRTFSSDHFNKTQKVKIGNLLNYLATNIPELYLTKLLKILYIIDELSVKRSGVPVSWLKYKVWKNGPVANKLYSDLRWKNGLQFIDYIEVIQDEEYSGFKIKPKSVFDDSEFSDYEMNLIDEVILKFKDKSADEIIDVLHLEGSLWYKIVEEENLQEKFEIDGENTTPFEIDFTDLIEQDADKLNHFIASKDTIEFIN